LKKGTMTSAIGTILIPEEPYDIASRKLTFSDIYNKWIETKEFDKLSKSAQKCYKAAYKREPTSSILALFCDTISCTILY